MASFLNGPRIKRRRDLRRWVNLDPKGRVWTVEIGNGQMELGKWKFESEVLECRYLGMTWGNLKANEMYCKLG